MTAHFLHFEMEQRLIRILQGCKNLMELKQIYLQILVNGLGNSNNILPRLMEKFSVLNSLNCVIRIFEASGSPNVVAHNAMIRCFTQHGWEIKAFRSYNRTRILGISPNHYTFTLLLNACRALVCLSCCEEIHAQLLQCGFGSHVFVQNVLLSVYSHCAANLMLARRVFDEMLEKDVISWNSMISAYMNRSATKQAIELFNSMPTRNIVSWNSIITALSKAGDMILARSFFDRMEARNTISWNSMLTGYIGVGDIESARSIFDQRWDKDVVSWTAMISCNANAGDMKSSRKLFDMLPSKNVVSWNAIISGYAKNSQFDESLVLFQSMLLDGKCLPDEATLVSVVSAIAHWGSLEHGMWINSYIKKANLVRTTALGNAQIDMFAKCGRIEDSKLVFNQMASRCIITWTTMISGLALNGESWEAVALFDRFCGEGETPDDVIFVAALSACAHGGLVDKGRKIFQRMASEYSIKPRMEHYGCMVDLLGRAGKFEEAVDFIRGMPVGPNVVIWATLLSCCGIHGSMEMLQSVMKETMKDFEGSEPGYRVLVSNSSARTGGWDRVADIRDAMWKTGVEKVPGCSLIEVGGEVHEFMVEDAAHRMAGEIYDALDGLGSHMHWME
ncbi:Pentatricopeptide repeat-containing protein [Platanthera guangdongensis]|uniref:Pentatricopeptide repeat-containing protein n=1 Tax=Platanthera guangdongensis TaxID=2320717 RepID=A0ABR2LWH0_9ASPA